MRACGWHHDPVQIGPETFKLDGRKVGPSTLVRVLRSQSPDLLHQFAHIPAVDELLSGWERLSPGQKYAII